MARDAVCQVCLEFKKTEKDFNRWLCFHCRQKFEAVEDVFFSKARFSCITREAGRRGFDISPFFRINRKQVFCSPNFLYLNGHLCKFSAIAGRSKLAPGGREYWHPCLYDFRNAKIAVIQTGDGRDFPYQLFFIPTEVVRGASINIPVKGSWSKYQQKRRPQVDWLVYRENWTTLGERKRTNPVSAQYLPISAQTSPA